MTRNFVALYRGETVADAQLVAVSSEPQIVARFIRDLAGDIEDPEHPDDREPLRVVRSTDDG